MSSDTTATYSIGHYATKRLALAVIIRAVIDASDGNPQAFSWLTSTGKSWGQVLEIQIGPAWIDRVKSGTIDKAALHTENRRCK